MKDSGGINIAGYEKTKETKAFLKNFFKDKKEYHYSSFKNLKTLSKAISDSQYELVIFELASGINGLDSIKGDIAKVVLISHDIPRGLREIVKHDIDTYLLPPFHEKDLEIKIKSALSRKSWFRELFNEKRDLEAIIELSFLVTSTLDPKEVLYFVVKKLSEMIEVTRCSIISIGFGEKRYANVVSSFESPEIRNIKLDLRKYPEIRKALKTKKPIIIEDAINNPIMKSVKKMIEPLGIRSIAVVPIIHRDEVIGTLFLRTSRAGRTFSEREIYLCTAIANVSANALYNAFLFEKLENERARLEKLAITDYLTGVYNIRYFYHRLEEEFSRAQRYGYPVSCIMMDIDHFKRINDTYGHRVGDKVLREFAQLVRRHTRKSDVFARYGGEEFILLLPQTPVNGAEIEAKRLRSYIKKHKFKVIQSRITTSMGIACWPVHNITTSDDLITLADHALFRAKSMGRDCVVISSKKSKKIKK
jgi:two-component system cell cycle response regulator